MVHASFSPQDARARSAQRWVTDLVAQEPPARELLDEVEARLSRVVPFDRGGWWTTDPETLLPAELWNFDIDVIERELTPDGSVQLEGTKPVSDAAEPAHSGSDLRFVSRSGQSVWGAACWTREDGEPPFSSEEVAFVTGIARQVGAALRTDLLRVAAQPIAGPGLPEPATASGTLVLGEGDVVGGYTPEAKVWLEKLGVIRLSDPLPAALRWIALQARARADGIEPAARLRPARSRLTTASGELVVVQAEVLLGEATTKVVMTLEPADSRSLFPLLLALHDLTAREKTVAGLLVAGWPLDDVAVHLSLSLHTVRDHVKAIYTKVGVRSRPELTARLGGASASRPAAVA
jgi:DNA-binding CsgD family transcriptional regulator